MIDPSDTTTRKLGDRSLPFTPSRDVLENPRRHLGDAVPPPPRQEVDDGKGKETK